MIPGLQNFEENGYRTRYSEKIALPTPHYKWFPPRPLTTSLVSVQQLHLKKLELWVLKTSERSRKFSFNKRYFLKIDISIFLFGLKSKLLTLRVQSKRTQGHFSTNFKFKETCSCTVTTQISFFPVEFVKPIKSRERNITTTYQITFADH